MRRPNLSAFSVALLSVTPVQNSLAQTAPLPKASSASASASTAGASKPGTPATAQDAIAMAPYTLHIQTRCAASLHVQGVANLPEQADMREIPEGLAFQADHHEAWLTGNACQANATVQLVAGSAIISNAVNYDTLRIDQVDGPLALHQGHGDIQVDRASALLYRGSGSGDLQLGTLHGPGLLALAGPGDVTIDNAELPSLTLSTSGPGDVVIHKGMIEDLIISLSGPGDASFDGKARNATLRTSASGNIRVQNVLDSFRSSAHASGTIEIAQTPDHGSLSSGKATERPHPVLNNTNGTAPDLQLPDGSHLNAHRMIKPDGTLIDFDALKHMGLEIAEATSPTPPEAAESDELAHSTSPTSHTHHSRSENPKTTINLTASIDSSSTTSGLIVLVVLALALMRRRIIPKLIAILYRANPKFAKQAEPFLLSLMSRIATPMPQTQLPQLLDLTERLHKLDKRVSTVESCVTSRDFNLHVQFRELDRRHN